jgi:hypothetical protein
MKTLYPLIKLHFKDKFTIIEDKYDALNQSIEKGLEKTTTHLTSTIDNMSTKVKIILYLSPLLIIGIAIFTGLKNPALQSSMFIIIMISALVYLLPFLDFISTVVYTIITLVLGAAAFLVKDILLRLIILMFSTIYCVIAMVKSKKSLTINLIKKPFLTSLKYKISADPRFKLSIIEIRSIKNKKAHDKNEVEEIKNSLFNLKKETIEKFDRFIEDILIKNYENYFITTRYLYIESVLNLLSKELKTEEKKIIAEYYKSTKEILKKIYKMARELEKKEKEARKTDGTDKSTKEDGAKNKQTKKKPAKKNRLKINLRRKSRLKRNLLRKSRLKRNLLRRKLLKRDKISAQFK